VRFGLRRRRSSFGNSGGAKAAGLVETLEGAGSFTVFAPTNHAFAKLPKSTVTTLMQPDSKSTLTKVLTYHVVPGRCTARELMNKIEQGGGRTTLKTVEGEDLTLTRSGRRAFTKVGQRQLSANAEAIGPDEATAQFGGADDAPPMQSAKNG
jgi:uncharacterized surface protein with fasciclin (FAS1) repeats